MARIETLRFGAVEEVHDYLDFDLDRRIEQRAKCVFCGSYVTLVYSVVDEIEWAREAWGWSGWECTGCSWWFSTEVSDQSTAASPSIHEGLLYKTPKNVPVDMVKALRAIESDRERLYAMEPTQFERFVGGLFHEYYDCEVEHVGRSNDQGIDLILLNCDRGHIPVQVKRRSAPTKTESVSIVREVFGGNLLQGYSNGIIVTTADHFSKAAVGAATAAERLGHRLELVDARRLFEIMRFVGAGDLSIEALRCRFRVRPEDATLRKIYDRVLLARSKMK